MPNSDSVESILADMRQKYLGEPEKTAKNSVENPLSNQEKQQKHSSLDKLLKELKQDLKANILPVQTIQSPSIKAENPESQNLEIERLVAQQKKQNQKIIAQKAQQWLDELDPLSGEGLWFTNLAKHYPSPLAAAIDLLENSSV